MCAFCQHRFLGMMDDPEAMSCGTEASVLAQVFVEAALRRSFR